MIETIKKFVLCEQGKIITIRETGKEAKLKEVIFESQYELVSLNTKIVKCQGYKENILNKDCDGIFFVEHDDICTVVLIELKSSITRVRDALTQIQGSFWKISKLINSIDINKKVKFESLCIMPELTIEDKLLSVRANSSSNPENLFKKTITIDFNHSPLKNLPLKENCRFNYLLCNCIQYKSDGNYINIDKYI
ncbi:MAG: hypothetical protein R3Y59_04635 [bacterium]